jgi:hypothetical protein
MVLASLVSASLVLASFSFAIIGQCLLSLGPIHAVWRGPGPAAIQRRNLGVVGVLWGGEVRGRQGEREGEGGR